MTATERRFALCGWLSLILTICLATGAPGFSAPEISREQRALKFRELGKSRVYWRDPSLPDDADPSSWIRFTLLGFSDFHGALLQRRLMGRPMGGASVLAAYLKASAAAGRDGAIIVHAGDSVGASPPISALMREEPTINFLNLLANEFCGVQQRMHPRCNLVGTLGNHEFDKGRTELMRLLLGGKHPEGPLQEPAFSGAAFPYVSANVIDRRTGLPLIAPYVVKRVRGMPIAIVGAVLKETPTIVNPAGVTGLAFLDEADAINKTVPELKAQGIRTIVVAIHQGAGQEATGGTTPPEEPEMTGAIVDILRRLDDEIDIVVSGHDHSFTNALIWNRNGKPLLVTQAFAHGTAYAHVDVAIDPATGDVAEKSATIVTTWADQGPGLKPVAAVASLVASAQERVKLLTERVIGVAADDILRSENEAGESALGNLIADAQRAAMGTDFAFMNAGGIRSDLLAGEVTWGEVFAVQPFDNVLVRMELTGKQIERLLNQQWENQPRPRMLKISGLAYTWDSRLPVGDRIVEIRDDTRIPLDPNAVYSVAANSFIAGGGDNFSVLTKGTGRRNGPRDLDTLVEYIGGLSQPFLAKIEGRIRRRNQGRK